MAKRSKKDRVLEELAPWIAARKRHELSHAHVQMARELGMNPKKLGRLDNHDQESWKLPLPEFIEELYRKRFKRDHPERVVSLEQRAAEIARKSEERKQRKRLRREAGSTPEPDTPDADAPLSAEPSGDPGQG